MQAWKRNDENQYLQKEPGFRPYAKEVPGLAPSPDPKDYGFKLVEVSTDESKRGLHRYRFVLNPTVRARFNADVVHRQQWLDLVDAFDKKLLSETLLHAIGLARLTKSPRPSPQPSLQ